MGNGLTKKLERAAETGDLVVQNANLTEISGEVLMYDSLVNVDLSINLIEHIPGQIADLRHLRTLNLSTNRITAVPTQLASCKRLEVLILDHNKLRDLPVYDVFFPMMLRLHTLSLSHNKIAMLPDTFCQAKSLSRLDASHNRLTHLPESMGLLRRLVHLNVSHNNLQSLPDSICKCRKLEVIDASSNSGLSLLPVAFLSSLHSLVVLDLGHTPANDFVHSLEGFEELLARQHKSIAVGDGDEPLSQQRHVLFRGGHDDEYGDGP